MLQPLCPSFSSGVCYPLQWPMTQSSRQKFNCWGSRELSNRPPNKHKVMLSPSDAICPYALRAKLSNLLFSQRGHPLSGQPSLGPEWVSLRPAFGSATLFCFCFQPDFSPKAKIIVCSQPLERHKLYVVKISFNIL